MEKNTLVRVRPLARAKILIFLTKKINILVDFLFEFTRIYTPEVFSNSPAVPIGRRHEKLEILAISIVKFFDISSINYHRVEHYRRAVALLDDN